MDINEALNTMCERCYNHEVCMGTGCEPKKTLEALVQKNTSKKIIKIFHGILDEHRGDLEKTPEQLDKAYGMPACPACKNVLSVLDTYCPACGQAINFDEEDL